MNQEGRNQKILPSILKKILTQRQKMAIIKQTDTESE